MQFVQAAKGHSPRHKAAGAFSILDLLVLIAILAILTLVLFPAFASSRIDSQTFQCLDDKRQLTLAWLMYQGDNSDRLMAITHNNTGSYEAINTDLNYMAWSSALTVTNTSGLVGPTALMAAFVSNVHVYKCPADTYQSALNVGPRTRSVSLNGALDGGTGSGPLYVNQIAGRTYFVARKVGDLRSPGPANIYVILDEQADSIDDFAFMNNEGYAPTGEHWRNLPAGYHNGAVGISFADGHCEAHRWQVWGSPFATVSPVQFVNLPNPIWSIPTLVRDADYEWLDNRTPYLIP